MLGWLRRRRDGQRTPDCRAPGLARCQVTFNNATVELKQPDGSQMQIAWAQLARVGIMTTSAGPAAPELFWLLQEHDRRINLVVPMGADGEPELLHEMQARLPGFDNMTVIEAMSSVDQAGFVVWQASDATAGFLER